MSRIRTDGFGLPRRRRSIRRAPPSFVAAVAVAAAAALASVPLAAPSAYAAPCVTTPSGLVAVWPGDGNTSELVTGRSGTLVGDAGYGVGEVGQAFRFDGDGDLVSVPDSPAWTLGADAFTIDMWVYLDDATRGLRLASHEVGLSHWWLTYNTGGLTFEKSEGGFFSWVNAPWAPDSGHWHNVAVTRDGELFTFYVDGAVVGSESSLGVWDIPDLDAPLRLGGDESGSSFAGRLDEFQLYSRALSGAELTALTSAGRTCAPAHATLALSGPTKALPGQSVTLTGTLAFGGGVSAAGQVVQITRQVGAQAATSVGSATVGGDGAFAFLDTAVLGVVTYRATFVGDATRGTTADSVVVTVRKGVARLSLAVSHSRVVFGQSVLVTAHLTGGSTNREVTIHAQPAGGQKSVIKQGQVGELGNLLVKVAPRSTTYYVASYTGDDGWRGASSGTERVAVAARWTLRPVGGYANDGKYRLFRWTDTCRKVDHYKGCPKASFTLAPNHAGTRVGLSFQVFVGGQWHSLPGYSVRVNANSTTYGWIWYKDREIIGVPLRIRSYFPGDSNHLSARSPWVYLKVTG